MGCLVTVVIMIGGLIGAVLGYIWFGFIAMTIWNWFVPGMFNLPEISMLQAIAISLVIGVFRMRVPTDVELEASERLGNKYLLQRLLTSFFTGLFILITAWVVRWMMVL